MLRTDKGRPDSTARHVLQVLAEHAHKDGSGAHPSILRIQYRTGYDERTVQRALRRLETAKLITPYGSINGRAKYRLSLRMKRPEFDWAELEAEAEAGKKAAAERQRKSRAKRVTHSYDVTVTHSESVTEPQVTHSDDVTEGDVTHSESVSHALQMRDVTHSASARHALSAPLTTNNHQNNHQEPFPAPDDASGTAATPEPGDTEDAPDDEVVDAEIVTAQVIVAEWIERCTERPPSRVIGQLAKEISQLLDDRIHPNHIRRGIATWMTKGLHPSTLASVVNEVMNTPAGNHGPTGRQATGNSLYDPATGTTVFDRARARVAARTTQEGPTP